VLECEEAEPAAGTDDGAEKENLKLELSESAGEIATEQPEALQAENGHVPHD